MICTLIIGQVLCLAFGFWIHNRLVVSSVEWITRNSADQPSPRGGTNAAGKDTETTAAAVTAETILEAMPSVNVVVCFWIAALQAGVAYLVLSRAQVERSRQQMESDGQTLQQTKDLFRTRDAVIFGLAKLTESRDPDTGHHLERIALYATRLASAMRRHPRLQSQVSSAFVRSIGISSALHDIGKVGIEDSILMKPGKLDIEERLQMQLHSNVGSDCIRNIERRLGSSNFLRMAREIAMCHHERWDGTGYPDGLAGEEIPLAARIVAIADVYDALATKRVYKPAFPHERCLAVIREGAGKQFDPDIVEVFLKIESQFREIARQFPDAQNTAAVCLDVSRQREPKHRLTAEQEHVLLSSLGTGESAPSREPAIAASP